jgi:phosphatidylglycerol lysyltransferase
VLARRLAPPLALLLVLGAIVLVAQRMGATLQYRDLVRAVRRVPESAIALSVLATAMSYVALLASDVFAARYARVRPRPAVLGLASFTGFALGNAAGLGALSGAAVRFRIYSAAGIEAAAIARLVAYLALSFALCAPVTAALAALFAATPIAELTGLPRLLIQGLSAALLLPAALCLAAGLRREPRLLLGKWQLRLPRTPWMLLQLLSTALDILIAGIALWMVLPEGGPGFLGFLGIYAAALVIGAASHLPGGIGAFDVVMLAALGTQMPPGAVAGALLIYRLVYFLLPVCVAVVLLAVYEIRQADHNRLGAAARPVARAAGRLIPTFLAALGFTAGAVLTVSGIAPAFNSRLAILAGAVPLWVVETANFLASIAGVVLLFVSRGLMRRLDGAWWMAVLISGAALVFSLAQGLAFNQTIFLAFFLCLLLLTRAQFDRPAALVQESLSGGWLIAVLVVILATVGLVSFAYTDVQYSRDLIWNFAFDAKAPRALRALVGAVVVAMVIALWQLLRAPAGRLTPASAEDLAAAGAILRAQDRAEANLALLGDKSFLFSRSGRAFLMYSKRGRTWVALFDPVGPREEWSELVSRFVTLAFTHEGRVAFYHIRAGSLPLYLDAGLSVRKLGEEAHIDLPAFDLSGSARAALRYTMGRAKRDGLRFEFLPSTGVAALLPVLEGISDAWLARRRIREKGFSVAGFSAGFVQVQQIALVRQHDEPVAFVSVMSTEHRSEAAVGLMRSADEASPYAMEYLFIELILHLKALGYRSLSMGMAPLSGLEPHPLSSRWHRIARWLREHGRHFYDFKGLRAFKNKFNPVWEPRYMAASGVLGPYLAIADTARLMNRGSRVLESRP